MKNSISYRHYQWKKEKKGFEYIPFPIDNYPYDRKKIKKLLTVIQKKQVKKRKYFGASEKENSFKNLNLNFV